jgi:hypothetical protein
VHSWRQPKRLEPARLLHPAHPGRALVVVVGGGVPLRTRELDHVAATVPRCHAGTRLVAAAPQVKPVVFVVVIEATV